MFVRIDNDLVINTNNILAYNIMEDADSYKLQIWSNSGNIAFNVIYLKNDAYQINLLMDFNKFMRGVTINAEPPVYNYDPSFDINNIDSESDLSNEERN